MKKKVIPYAIIVLNKMYFYNKSKNSTGYRL